MDTFFIVTNILTYKQFLRKVHNYTEEQAVAKNIAVWGADIETGNKFAVATLVDGDTLQQVGHSWVSLAGGVADALSTAVKQLALEYNLEEFGF